jgi:class 3 adenylate cyclase
LSYKPKPKDTSKIELAPGLKELVERLAENTHDVWAQQRILSGWTYGPHRDDSSKQHPGLVPYSELSESEKEYDRKTSLETVKLLSALGYTIQRPGEQSVEPPKSSGSLGERLAALRRMLDASPPPKLAELAAFWDAQDRTLLPESPDIFKLLGERFLKLGEPLFAHDVIDEGLKSFPADVRLRQLHALTLARSGASGQANLLLKQLYGEGHTDEETLSLLARTHKDLAERSENPQQRQEHLRRAQQLYAQAHDLHGGYYGGINAATLALLLGDHANAKKLAQVVRGACKQELEKLGQTKGDAYWPTATLGEAALLLEEWSEAEEWYCRAALLGGKRFGDLCSTRRNARMIVAYLHADAARFERCFHIPSVVLFAGHMIDQPGRAVPRFPPPIEAAVRDAIRDQLKKLNAGFGFASVACGADILFLEGILELEGEARVVLPYDKSQFIKDSVEIVPGSNWGARCEAVLQRAASITVSCDHRLTGASVVEFQYANLLLQGLAAVLAKQLDTSLKPLAVWDGKRGDGLGGTSWNVQRWQEAGFEVDVIRLDKILRNNSAASVVQVELQAPATPAIVSAPAEFVPDICGLLFADAVGFSKLTENEVHLFVRYFLGLVGQVIEKSAHPPLVKNTWGDGLHFVFKNARDTGVFALEVCNAICCEDWKSKGICDLAVRIGLHAGPAYACLDPVTGRPTYIGASLSRAARIEPITPPGHVYASQGFAAMAAVEGVREFTCDYVGRIPQAKNYGTFPTYVVRKS